ncbi:hypothetical protein LX32DRAFT_646871 [Colletotrichum zoysiae]|uniref:Uncharacterized protein n=1 Tax=Colletotrichum zoysiae TaxID=1216348 RepID=A0AAD9H386_9PEZI|nr:hypothetical protein LX32DRAFT_646871 [Colletotrichum zoysiae]
MVAFNSVRRPSTALLACRTTPAVCSCPSSSDTPKVGKTSLPKEGLAIWHRLNPGRAPSMSWAVTKRCPTSSTSKKPPYRGQALPPL